MTKEESPAIPPTEAELVASVLEVECSDILGSSCIHRLEDVGRALVLNKSLDGRVSIDVAGAVGIGLNDNVVLRIADDQFHGFILVVPRDALSDVYWFDDGTWLSNTRLHAISSLNYLRKICYCITR